MSDAEFLDDDDTVELEHEGRPRRDTSSRVESELGMLQDVVLVCVRCVLVGQESAVLTAPQTHSMPPSLVNTAAKRRAGRR